jgi:hypothetical protein
LISDRRITSGSHFSIGWQNRLTTIRSSGAEDRDQAARHWWDADYIRKNLPDAVFSDPRPGVSETQVWWRSNQIEVGIFLYGYESAWLPASLLEKEQQKHLADALFASSRHWEVALHFNKGLAGAPP